MFSLTIYSKVSAVTSLLACLDISKSLAFEDLLLLFATLPVAQMRLYGLDNNLFGKLLLFSSAIDFEPSLFLLVGFVFVPLKPFPALLEKSCALTAAAFGPSRQALAFGLTPLGLLKASWKAPC